MASRTGGTGRTSRASRTGETSKTSNTRSTRIHRSGFRDLVLWKESKQLVKFIYRVTNTFPKEEVYGLTSQMKRASISVMSNIAEGWKRKSKHDKLRFLEIAEGSLLELESQIEVSKDLRFMSEGDYLLLDEQRAKVGYLLYRYAVETGKSRVD